MIPTEVRSAYDDWHERARPEEAGALVDAIRAKGGAALTGCYLDIEKKLTAGADYRFSKTDQSTLFVYAPFPAAPDKLGADSLRQDNRDEALLQVGQRQGHYGGSGATSAQ